jgi:hypothetical protein
MFIADTPKQIDTFRLICLKSSLDSSVRTDGKLLASRTLTPTRMRELATEYTGVRYVRGMAGVKDALRDIAELVRLRQEEREV